MRLGHTGYIGWLCARGRGSARLRIFFGAARSGLRRGLAQAPSITAPARQQLARVHAIEKSSSAKSSGKRAPWTYRLSTRVRQALRQVDP